jgi:hypothetical protein
MRYRRQHFEEHHPGVLPVIRTENGNVTFEITPLGIPGGERLIIRCDSDGNLRMAILPPAEWPE